MAASKSDGGGKPGRPTKASIEGDKVLECVNFVAAREGAESENRSGMTQDLEFCFVPGAQWDATAKTKRAGRPMYSYNRTVRKINQVIGDQRQARPSGKVRAVNKKASVEVAETFSGLIRNIEASSQASWIYDEAFKYAIAGAWGSWCVVPEFCDDEGFDQELRVHRIPNPQTVYFDDKADPYGRGAMRVAIVERMPVAEYESLYGEMPSNMQAARDGKGWLTKDEVRIARYYRKDFRDKKIALLSDGRIMPYTGALDDELKAMNAAVQQHEGAKSVTVTKTRTVKEAYVTWWLQDGKRILEGPIEYKYKHIPAVRLPGRFVNIEGKQYFQSMIRHAKHAARSYNNHRSTMVELVALTPRAPYIVTVEMIKGREDEWAKANVSNAPYLAYTVDTAAPSARPQREPPPDVPQALIALAQQDAEDIDQTSGYVGPRDVPDQTMPESGKARRLRLMSGEAGAYEFLDNLEKAIQFTWEICIDMIPVHYDNERVVRIIGEDGKDEQQTINGQGDDGIVRRLADGKYDVTVTLGPAYATARMEALDTLLDAAEKMPIIADVGADVIVESMDVKGGDELTRRIRKKLINDGVIEPTEEEAKEMPPAPPPDPTTTALANELSTRAAKNVATARKLTVDANIAEATAQATATSELKKEMLELRKLFEEVRKQQIENALLIKQLRAPVEPTNASV